jgi:hypothetical protein
MIGSIRRECLDHVIVYDARGLRRVLNVAYYLKSPTDLSLNKDTPVSRLVVSHADSDIVAIPEPASRQRYEHRAVKRCAHRFLP